MSIYEVFTLLGGVGLFLYGMTIMSSGLRNACGERLKVMLEQATRNKVTSVLAGILVTIFIQSSSATDVMVIGFVTSGLMTLTQAIGVIMGANIGTTVTAQITAFNIGAYAPFILFLGAVVHLFVKNKTLQYVGEVILGFGMLFVGITLMKSAIAPLAQTPQFIGFVSTLSNPIITVIFGVLFTALLQSSSSATVIFQAFAMQGIISYRIAVYLIIGAAVGSVTPNLLAGLTANRVGKRCAVLNLLFNLIRACLVLLLITIFPQILTFIQNLSPGNVARAIANTHTAFAIIAVLILLPFTEMIVKLSEIVVPFTEEETKRAEDHRLVYLINTDKMPAALAVDQAHREVVRMGEIAVDNLKLAISVFFEHDDKTKARIDENEATVDYLTTEIVQKLLDFRALNGTARDMNRIYNMIRVVDDIERISDHAVNISSYETTIHEGKAKISEDGLKDLRELSDATIRSLECALDVFRKEDLEGAFEAALLENKVDELKDKVVNNHLERLMKNACDPAGGVIFTDMSIDLERCSDHAINLVEALEV